jgi:hypothetical protein
MLLAAASVLMAGCVGPLAVSNGSPAASLAEVPEITPRPTPSIALPKTYAKLAKADWTKVLSAPARSLGNGYQVWACITQFDTTTGRESFRAAASYRKEPAWARLAANAAFNGTEKQLAVFANGDVVQMNVVGLGPVSYPTQANGTMTVPTFFVTRIAKKGSCG